MSNYMPKFSEGVLVELGKYEYLPTWSPKKLDMFVTEALTYLFAEDIKTLLGTDISKSTRGIVNLPVTDSEVLHPEVFVSLDEQTIDEIDTMHFENRSTEDLTFVFETDSPEEVMLYLKTYISLLPHGVAKQILCLRTGVEIDRITKQISFTGELVEVKDIALHLDLTEEEVINYLTSSQQRFRHWFDGHEQLNSTYIYSVDVFDKADRPIERKYLSVLSHRGRLTQKENIIKPIAEFVEKIVTIQTLGYYKELPSSCVSLVMVHETLLKDFGVAFNEAKSTYEQIVVMMKDEQLIVSEYDEILAMMHSFVQQVQIAKELTQQIVLENEKVTNEDKRRIHILYNASLNVKESEESIKLKVSSDRRKNHPVLAKLKKMLLGE